jgi:hypothetical protein
MNAEIIEEVSHGIQFGAMSFPEAVGKRVLYFGRNGEQHVEWFPGAKP